jgi:hypothetical protein
MGVITFAIHLTSVIYMMPSRCAEIIYTYRQLSYNFTRSLPTVLDRYPACADLTF